MRWGEEDNGEWEGVMAGLKLRASMAPGSWFTDRPRHPERYAADSRSRES